MRWRCAEFCKRFPGVVALDDVSISLGKGEVLALVGENGAGKSTLMKILSGAFPADAGTIEIFGKPVSTRHRIRCWNSALLSSIRSFSSPTI